MLSPWGRRAAGDANTTDLYMNRSDLDIYGQAFLMQAMYLSNPRMSVFRSCCPPSNTAAAKSAASAWWNEKGVDY